MAVPKWKLVDSNWKAPSTGKLVGGKMWHRNSYFPEGKTWKKHALDLVAGQETDGYWGAPKNEWVVYLSRGDIEKGIGVKTVKTKSAALKYARAYMRRS